MSVVAATVAVRVAAVGRDARRARAPLATRAAHSSSKASRSEEIRHVAHRVLHDSEPLVTQHVAHAREGPVAIHLAYAGARRLHALVPLGEDGIAPGVRAMSAGLLGMRKAALSASACSARSLKPASSRLGPSRA